MTATFEFSFSNFERDDCHIRMKMKQNEKTSKNTAFCFPGFYVLNTFFS